MHRRNFINHTVDRVATFVIAAAALNPVNLARSTSSTYAGMTTETPSPLPTDSSTNIMRKTREGQYVMEYHWEGNMTPDWELQFEIEQSAYHAATQRSLGYRSAFEAAQQNPCARNLAADLDAAESTSQISADLSLDIKRFDRAVEFVRSIQYLPDYESRSLPDYHRAVEETLVDGCGDCKDHTYLLAGVLSQPPFEFRTAMVFVPNHMLLGVDLSDLPAAYADAPTLSDTNYVAVESVAAQPIGDYEGGPILAIYGDGFEYVDQAAITDTSIDFLRDPTEYQIVSGMASR